MLSWQDNKRLVEVLETFAAGGFAYYLHKSRLSSCVSWKCRLKCLWYGCFCPPEAKSMPIYFRQTLEKLGPAFIKLGQMLSVRPDLIPVEYCDELRKLQDKVPPFSFNEVRDIIEKEINGKLAKTYSSFADVPLASASIAQVHKAKLKSGKTVAVKVQRPNLTEQIERDLRVLAWATDFMENKWKACRPYRPKKLAAEFSDWTRRELDFRIEAKCMNEIKENFRGKKSVFIPDVFWKCTGKNVLTMSFVDGCNIYNEECLKNNKINKTKLAVNGARAMFEQAIVHGVFHGDPHPGNLVAMKGNRVGFLDFGIVGRLSMSTRKKLLYILSHLVEKDFDEAIEHTLELAEVSAESDIKGYKSRLYRVFSDWSGSPVSQNTLTKALFTAIADGIKFKVYFSPDLVLFSKMLVTTEGVGALLNPDFDMSVEAKPFIREAMLAELSPVKFLKQFVRNALEHRDFLSELPGHMINLIKKIEGRKEA